MTTLYTPEIGQVIAMEPWEQYEASDDVVNALTIIEEHLYEYGHIEDAPYTSPFRNSGATFKNDVFQIRAYDWGWDFDDDRTDLPEPNFRWKDFEVRWYKYLGRGTTMNRDIEPREVYDMLQECIESLKSKEE